MPRKKQLKTRGSLISAFNVQIKQVESSFTDSMIDIVDLEVTTSDGVSYKYDIRQDEREPDLVNIKKHIEDCLQKARQEFLNVEISEYKERSYLFFKVQSIGQAQYTGFRI